MPREASAGAGCLVDALPYIVVGYDDDPDTRQDVLSLIEGESPLKLWLPVSLSLSRSLGSRGDEEVQGDRELPGRRVAAGTSGHAVRD